MHSVEFTHHRRIRVSLMQPCYGTMSPLIPNIQHGALNSLINSATQHSSVPDSSSLLTHLS